MKRLTQGSWAMQPRVSFRLESRACLHHLNPEGRRAHDRNLWKHPSALLNINPTRETHSSVGGTIGEGDPEISWALPLPCQAQKLPLCWSRSVSVTLSHHLLQSSILFSFPSLLPWVKCTLDPVTKHRIRPLG